MGLQEVVARHFGEQRERKVAEAMVERAEGVLHFLEEFVEKVKREEMKVEEVVV